MILTYNSKDSRDEPVGYVASNYVPLYMGDSDDNDDVSFHLISGSLDNGIWVSMYVYAVTYTYNGTVVVNYGIFSDSPLYSSTRPSLTLMPSSDLYIPETIVFSKTKTLSEPSVPAHARKVCIEDYGDAIKITTGFESQADYMEWKLSQ